LNAAAPGTHDSMLRRIAVAVVSLVAFVAADATAHAKVFRGETEQGRRASVVIGSDGLLRAMRINWRARCRKGRVVQKTIFTRPHDQSTPDAFLDAGVYRMRSGAFRLRVDGRVTGRRSGTGARERWRGSFRAKVLVTRRGRYVDTCRIRGLRWSARVVR